MYRANSYMQRLVRRWPAGSSAASSLLPCPSKYNSLYRCLGSGGGGGVYTSESPASISLGSGGGGLADQLLRRTKVSPWLLIPPPNAASAGNIPPPDAASAGNLPPPDAAFAGNVFGNKRSPFYDYYYSLAENRVKSIKAESCISMWNSEEDALCIGSSHGWLTFVNRLNYSAFLFNPITQRRIELPSIRTLTIPNRTIAPTDIGAIAALSSPEAEAEDCRLMISYDSGEARGQKLAFCCPGHGEKFWTCLQSPLVDYNSMVYSSRHRMFVTLNEDFQVECWDLSDPLSPKVTRRINDLKVDVDVYPSRSAFASVKSQAEEEELYRKAMSHDSHYLVPIPYADHDLSSSSSPCGQFYWVVRYVAYHVNREDGSMVDTTDDTADEDAWRLPYKTWTFDVYEFDLTDGVLWYMDRSLEDHAIFVGLNDSFALSAMDFPELRPNSIYFTDDYSLSAYDLPYKDQPFGGHDVGIYNYKDKTFEECYYPCDHRNITRIEPYPIWFIPDPL